MQGKRQYEFPSLLAGMIAYFWISNVRRNGDVGLIDWEFLPKQQKFQRWDEAEKGYIVRLQVTWLLPKAKLLKGEEKGCVYEQKCWKIWASPKEFVRRHPGNMSVWVQDKWGSRVCVQVSDILKVAHQRHNNWGSLVYDWWSNSHWKNWYDNERTELLAIMEETIRRLDESKRFIKSSQAAEIRKWLEEKFVKHRIPRVVLSLQKD